MKHWPFKVINDSSKPKVEVEYKGEIKTFFAEEISSMVLTKMKEIAEAYLGKVIQKMLNLQKEETPQWWHSIICIINSFFYSLWTMQL